MKWANRRKDALGSAGFQFAGAKGIWDGCFIGGDEYADGAQMASYRMARSPGPPTLKTGCIAAWRTVYAPYVKDEQVPEVVDTIRQWAGTVTDRQKAGHVAHVRKKKAKGQG